MISNDPSRHLFFQRNCMYIKRIKKKGREIYAMKKKETYTLIIKKKMEQQTKKKDAPLLKLKVLLLLIRVHPKTK